MPSRNGKAISSPATKSNIPGPIVPDNVRTAAPFESYKLKLVNVIVFSTVSKLVAATASAGSAIALGPSISPSNIIHYGDFPTLSDNYRHNLPKFIVYDESSTIEEYIQVHKEDGLSHLILDGAENRKKFFNQVFNNESDYPYLEKVFDSDEKEFKYHVKIFKINYEKFENEHG